jgi:hypothetical protein
LWKAQVLPALQGAQVMGLLDGSDRAPAKTMAVEDEEKKKIIVANPANDVWISMDQQVTSFLLKTLSPDVIADIIGLEHAAEVLNTIGDIFSAQSEDWVGMLRAALTNTKKKDLAAVYIANMKGFSSELAAAGRVISDIELKEYLLAGLAGEYNALVASINANPATSTADVCNQLMAYGYRQDMLAESKHPTGVFNSSENAAARGRGARSRHGGVYRHGPYGGNNNYYGYTNYGGGHHQPRGCPPCRQDAPEYARRLPPNGWHGRGRSHHTPSPHQDITCQICTKYGHPRVSVGGAIGMMMTNTH